MIEKLLLLRKSTVFTDRCLRLAYSHIDANRFRGGQEGAHENKAGVAMTTRRMIYLDRSKTNDKRGEEAIAHLFAVAREVKDLIIRPSTYNLGVPEHRVWEALGLNTAIRSSNVTSLHIVNVEFITVRHILDRDLLSPSLLKLALVDVKVTGDSSEVLHTTPTRTSLNFGTLTLLGAAGDEILSSWRAALVTMLKSATETVPHRLRTDLQW